MSISPQRIEADIQAIAACTHTPDQGATRPTFSDAWGAARAYVIQQAESAGCEVRTDAAGNLRARPKELDWKTPAWLVGSHIDSVPNGGDYDGVAGVVVGLEVLRATQDLRAGEQYVAPVELIVFAEEEGPTFGVGLLGSRAAVGELGAKELAALTNAAGQNYLEAGAAYGVDPEKLDGPTMPLGARVRPGESPFLGLIEVHIEQGPGLWRRGESLALVTSIAGRQQFTVTLTGEANHAGATAMIDRRDALAAAAEMTLALETLAETLGDGVVLTVGRLDVQPNAINVIAGAVSMTIDFRAPRDEALARGATLIPQTLEAIAQRRGVTLSLQLTEAIAARPLSARVLDRLRGAVAALDWPALPEAASGALHDAAVLAPHVPTAMLFVASRDGISHNPEEYSRMEDIAKAAKLVERAVSQPTVAMLNAGNAAQFVAVCGPFFEHAPWVAEATWPRRPFADRPALHEALCQIVGDADEPDQLKLIRGHPDLVGRLAREGRLTQDSTAEQRAAGLTGDTGLTADEADAFERYNQAYRAKFGFPFVICARENRKQAILEAFPRRLEHDADAERAEALEQIFRIAWHRLDQTLRD